MTTIRRTIHPEVRVLDSKAGTVEYVASDESLDSYREVIRAAGWRFTHFQKNAPFVDSHDYSTIDKVIGRVLDFRVEKGRLLETVQFARDVAENSLAQKAWAMTQAGYLKAVSVGFWPVRAVSRWDGDTNTWREELADLGLNDKPEPEQPRTIYLEQEQIELSAVVIGANPNALARAYKAGILTDEDLETFSTERERRSSPAAIYDALAAVHRAHQRRRFVEHIKQLIN